MEIKYSNEKIVNTYLVINETNSSVPETFDNLYYSIVNLLISLITLIGSILIIKKRKN